MARVKPQEVLVAIPRGDPSTLRSVVMAMETYKVPITTLPALREILNGKVVVDQIRKLSIEDLLPRAPVGLDPTRVRQLISGKRVMVTGAGGSIGSELCRQIARFEPSELILYERYENGLYDIVNDLMECEVFPPISSVIGDVTDRQRLDAVMCEHRPQLVFHAAAHKHVPLMEHNPCEAVKNNVTGTRSVAETAKRHGAELFVLISTDKAVNPSSVMGATKRIAELILQSTARSGSTAFVAVRFGNVLGSNGSLVPRFLHQINAGGPVTVTHPEIRRYFMLIPEAVHLVLHAAAMGQNGGMYTLEMGDQIKVLDMARNLIRLSGFVPEEEIPIMFIGLRPGEKLSEELVGADEIIEGSPIEKILRVRPRHDASDPHIMDKVAELERFAARNDPTEVGRQLSRLLPSFRPETDAVPAGSRDETGPRPVVLIGNGEERRTVVRFPQPATMFADRRDPAVRTRRKSRGGGRRLTDMIAVPERDSQLPSAARR
jgi:FlaA1/EpsC-like NDP-sugar epimerase